MTVACEPFDPPTGTFIDTSSWGTQQSPPWSFSHDHDSGGFAHYVLEKNGTTEDTLLLDSGAAVRWIFFGGGDFLAVREAVSSAGSVQFNIYVYDLRSTVSRYLLGHGPYAGSGGTPQLHFHHTSDGTAFFVFIGGDGLPNETHTHRVIRTATGDLLCSWGSVVEDGERQAEITGDGHVRMYTSPGPGGSTTIGSPCPLPRGELSVSPATQTFPTAVVGGADVLASTTDTFTLTNTGDDCITVESIGDVSPFSVTDSTLPADLDPGDSTTVEVTFAPSTTGAFSEQLPVTRTPAKGDDALVCEGTAREPEIAVSVSPSALGFGKVPVGTSETEALTIANAGEAAVDVSVAASTDEFTWDALDVTIPYGESETLNVTFEPPSEGSFSKTLTVVSDAPSSPTNVPVSGVGCVPNPSVGVPPVAPLDFGEVERGFRTVRTITVTNAGDGPLTFDARVDGADASLFGLQPPEGNVVDVESVRPYTVEPTAANVCGDGPTGPGEVVVGVAFHAAAAPGPVSAELVIENHNDASAGQDSWTFPLSATITDPRALDAGLVLDRSGSMSDPLGGSATKSDAAVRAGKLYAHLVRPDVDDRLAVVRYNQAADVLQAMTKVDSGNQESIVDGVNSSSLSPSGSTSIAAGTMTGLEEMATPRATTPDDLTKAMVVLTDGKDNTAYQDPSDGNWYSLLGGEMVKPGGGTVSTDPIPTPGDVRVYSVGLGREEDVDKGKLEKLAFATGAYPLVTGELTGQTYFDLEKYFTQLFMDAVGMSTVRDPVFTIDVGEKHAIEFDVLKGDVSALVVVYDRDVGRLPFHLVSPSGEHVEPTVVPAGYQLRAGATDSARFVELRLPAGEPDRYAGTWTVVVTHDGEVCQGIPSTDPEEWQQGAYRRGFQPRDCRRYDDPVDYGLAVGVGSNFRMQPYVTPGTVRVGDPILTSATVTEAGLPVTDCEVSVRATSPSGNQWTFDLRDDGSHRDGDADDGEYAREFTKTAEAGSYEFLFRAEGESRDGESVTREALLSKYVEGRVPVEPDTGNIGDVTDAIEECCARLRQIRLGSSALVGISAAVALRRVLRRLRG